MTKKDYIKIADIIKAYKTFDILTDFHIRLITDDFVRMLEEDNPRFDRETFINYINK